MNESHDPFNPPASAASALPQIDLTQYDAEFEQAEATESEDVPDGKYQVRVLTARLNKSQSGNPMMQYDLVVISGQYAGRHVFKNSVITSNAMPFLKADLKVLGIELPKLSDLATRLVAMLDQNLEVTKKTKGDYSNVYFNKRLQLPAGATPEPIRKESIPF